MKYYHEFDRYLRKQFRERTIALFYAMVFLTLLAVLGTGFIYLNIMTLQLGVNVGLPIYYTVYITLLLVRGVAFRYLPGLVDAAVLRRHLRFDVVAFGSLLLIGVALHVYIVESYAAAGVDEPPQVLAVECVAALILAIGTAVHLASIYFSGKWTRTEIELAPMEAGEA